MWEPDDAPALPPTLLPYPPATLRFIAAALGRCLWPGARDGLTGTAGRALPCASPVLLPRPPALPPAPPCPPRWRSAGCSHRFGRQWVSLGVLSGLFQARQVPRHSLLLLQPQGNGTAGAARLVMTRNRRGLNVSGVPTGRKQGSRIPGPRGTARCCSPAPASRLPAQSCCPGPQHPRSVRPASRCAICGDGSSATSAPCCSVLLFYFSLTQARPQEPNYF